MNAESSRLRSTETTSSDIGAIWAGALLTCYLGVTGVLLIVGRERVAIGSILAHFAALTAVAASTWHPAVPRWLRSWTPLLLLLFLYAETPFLIRAAGHEQFFDATVAGWERGLFGGQPAIEWATRWSSRAASELLHAAYLSYYGIIFSVPVGLYLAGRRADFAEAVFVVMLTFVTCFLSYVVFPVAGPRYLWPWPAEALSGPIRATTLWLLETGSSRGTAFPSSHVAVAITQSILAVHYFGKKGLSLGALTFGLALGAVYGGFHYAVDVAAGVIVGSAVAFVGFAVAKYLRRNTRAQAKASAPT